MKKLLTIILLLITSINGFSQWRDSKWQSIGKNDLIEYGSRLNGKFSSAQQNAEEPYFDKVFYNAINYKLTDTLWIYMEQGTDLDKPYRQRVYVITLLNDTTIQTKYYALKDAKNFVINNQIGFGLDSFKDRLNKITISDLIYMSGCDNTIHKGEDGNFYSKSGGSNCGGSYNGATYTTSEFRLYNNMIVSWERGWKADGTQAWGSFRGFYYFRKISTHIF